MTETPLLNPLTAPDPRRVPLGLPLVPEGPRGKDLAVLLACGKLGRPQMVAEQQICLEAQPWSWSFVSTGQVICTSRVVAGAL